MLIEATVVGLVGLAAYKALKPGKGVMTPKRRLVFQHALNKVDPPLSPDQLLELADIMDGEGLPAYSEILRKRAAMRAQSPELKAAHRAAYRKARSSSDPLNVRIAANAFESQGKTAIAADLRNYADSLDVGAAMAPTAGSAVMAATDPGMPAPPPAVSQEAAASAAVTEAPAAVVSGEPAFGEESTFEGSSAVIIAASSAKPAVVSPGGVGIAAQEVTGLVGNTDPNGPAAQLGMTDEQYAAFMAGQPIP